MTALQELLAMGGYAGFVWPAFLLAAVVMLGLWAVSARDWRRSQATLSALRQDQAAAAPAPDRRSS